MGYKAISLTGWQIPIVTTDNFGDARIKSIRAQTILDLFEKGYIVIIAGFQGINENGEITTLGRMILKKIGYDKYLKTIRGVGYIWAE